MTRGSRAMPRGPSLRAPARDRPPRTRCRPRGPRRGRVRRRVRSRHVGGRDSAPRPIPWRKGWPARGRRSRRPPREDEHLRTTGRNCPQRGVLGPAPRRVSRSRPRPSSRSCLSVPAWRPERPPQSDCSIGVPLAVAALLSTGGEARDTSVSSTSSEELLPRRGSVPSNAHCSQQRYPQLWTMVLVRARHSPA